MLFTDVMELGYKISAENMMADKQMLCAQFVTAVSNQQSAAYTLRKATPVVKLPDKPDSCYKKSSSSLIFDYFICTRCPLIKKISET